MALALTNRWVWPSVVSRGLWSLFDKDLRVASRRQRGYILRFAYVFLLMLYIVMIWLPTVHFQGGGAMSKAQMEMAAKIITWNVVWFQFLAAQLVAVIMMSTAISEEIYGRTLCVLMTTPLSSRTVVMGKFYSRLFQILLLVATSLPLLAIVRVLGGIPWGFLVQSLCVTAASVAFAGAVSLFISSLCRRPHVVVIASVVSIAFLFFILPYVACFVMGIPFWRLQGLRTLAPMNPYVLLRYGQGTSRLFGFRGMSSPGLGTTISCCAFLLLGTMVLLRASVRLVTRVALRRAMGERVFFEYLRREPVEPPKISEASQVRRREIRRVMGPPMVWKELTCTLSRRERFTATLTMTLEGLMILIAYSFPALIPFVPYEVAHQVYIWIFLGLGVLFTITASITVVSKERESHAWWLLMTTPLTDTDILLGKLAGVLRRCGPIWLLLFVYVVGFVWAKCFHSMAIVHVAAIIVSSLMFLCAAGFYLGARCRQTTGAVTAEMALAGGLWGLLPLVAATVSYGLKMNWDVGGSLIYAMVPFGQALAMVTTTLDGYVAKIPCFGRAQDAAGIATILLIATAGYVLASLVFTWRAVRAFRRMAL